MTASAGIVERHVGTVVAEALGAFRVVVVHGPRQSGKSTLVRQIQERLGGPVHNLDNELVRQAALEDPAGLSASDERYVYIDEVQRGGDALVRAVKERVDDPANTTKYLLAGSTGFLTVPTLAESLAGRAIIVEVWPFTQGEIEGRRDSFLDALATGALGEVAAPSLPRDEYLERVWAGGYPEPLGLPAHLRALWFASYVETVTRRDVSELTGSRRLGEVSRLLAYLAGKTGGELVKARLANETGIERHTLAGYLDLLDAVFLVAELPAWSRNPLGKVTRTPKVHVTDTGLAAHLHGVTPAALAKPVAPMRGQLLESFVHNELVRQRTWAGAPVTLSHWRDRDGAEVDFVVETPAGEVAGIEAKASSTVTREDFRWLRRLDGKLGDEFVAGIVLYLGTETLSFGGKMLAMPVSALWA